jgi:hypothetical protein
MAVKYQYALPAPVVERVELVAPKLSIAKS